MLKTAIKRLFWGVFLIIAFPIAVLSAFGRMRAIYTLFAHACALVPGIIGDYIRIAYYKLTLTECALDSRISFGSFFVHPDVRLASAVYIGAYCVIGKTTIGARTQIATGVQILSGRHQHSRGQAGEIAAAEAAQFTRITVGADCWIGAAAIVMADVGHNCTIGAGSVVSRDIPPGSVAAGVPARVIKSTATQISEDRPRAEQD